MQFQCSRLTARAALQQFVYSGIINARQRSGYIVALEAKNLLFLAPAQQVNSNHQKLTELQDDKIIAVAKSYSQMPILKNDIKFACSKRYYKKKALVLWQISLFNKNEILFIDKQRIKKSVLDFFHYYGIIPTIYTEHILYTTNKVLQPIAKKLGWEGHGFLIAISILKNEQTWIEFSLKIFAPNKINFSKVVKIFNH